MGRAATGISLATLTLTAAVLVSGRPWAVAIFVALTALALILTVAHRLPVLHALPPPVGAPRPPTRVDFGLEGHDGLTFRMASGSREAVVVRMQIPPEGRPDEIRRVMVNAWVTGATHFHRVQQSGARYPDGGLGGHGSDGPYWSVSGVTLPIGHYAMFFKITIREPGEYEAVVTLQSPEFHDHTDHYYRAKITALPPE